ncbi:unnamed protein product [Caretta caretta]
MTSRRRCAGCGPEGRRKPSLHPLVSGHVALPPLQNSIFHLGLSQAFLKAVLSVLVQSQPQTCICTPVLDLFSVPGGKLQITVSLTRLEVVNIQLPRVLVTLLPGIGGQLTIATKLEISGNLLLSGLIHISVDVNLIAKVRVTDYSAGVFQVVTEDCQSLLGPFDIRLLLGLLPVSVNGLVSSTLTTTLPSLLCPVVSNITKLVNVQLLGTLNVLVPLGAVGNIQYQLASLPLITDLYVGLDLNAVIQQVGGDNISLPGSAVPVPLPPLQGNVLNLGLSQAFLNAVLSLLGRIQPQTFISKPDVFSGATQLTDAITALIPAGCPSCSVVSPLNIKITVLGPPLITLEANKATVKLSVKIQVFKKYSDGTIQTLLALKADLVLNAQVSVAGGKLLLSVSLTSADLILESSDVGIVSVSSLGTLINKLLVETFVPLINEALTVGLPLPNVLGIKLINAVQIVEGLVVVRSYSPGSCLSQAAKPPGSCITVALGQKSINPIAQLPYSTLEPPGITSDYTDRDLNISSQETRGGSAEFVWLMLHLRVRFLCWAVGGQGPLHVAQAGGNARANALGVVWFTGKVKSDAFAVLELLLRWLVFKAWFVQ